METSMVNFRISDATQTVEIFVKAKANEPYTLKDLIRDLKENNKDIMHYDIITLDFEIVDEIED